MTTNNDRQSIDASARPSLDKKNQNVEHVEKTGGSEDLAAEILQRYPLLVEKSAEELAELNKKVLRILDWKFLPCVTVMLLMKYPFTPALPSRHGLIRLFSYLDRINVSNARVSSPENEMVSMLLISRRSWLVCKKTWA